MWAREFFSLIDSIAPKSTNTGSLVVYFLVDEESNQAVIQAVVYAEGVQLLVSGALAFAEHRPAKLWNLPFSDIL